MSDEPVEISNQEDGQGEQTPSSKKPGFAPASADLEIFKLLYEYRFLRREHFSLLTGRNPTSLHYRLKKLADNGYLNDLKVAKQPGQKHIYSLGKPAFRSLVEKGIADEEVLIKRLRTHELKPLYLNHEMMIIDFHVMLSLATRGSFLRLVRCEEGRHLYDSVVVKGERLPVTPDAFFTLEDSRRPAGRNLADFFLEADRTTETWPKQFQNKVRAYWCYLKDGPHEKNSMKKQLQSQIFECSL